MERRLAAILAADMAGYSRLIRADEEGTIAALKALLADLINPKLSRFNGRIVKLMGDGMLAEFPSVVDAVRAAVETQQAVAEHNSDLPEDKRIRFRVGINLGDVVIDGDDIYGDGVNIAARLEGLASPGGICISDKVYEEVRDRTDFAFVDMGEQEVKNIDRPVRVWRWAADTPTAALGSEKESAPLSLPDKPSIAVLPFENMSGDPEQEYFSDGITEDIITALSRSPWLFVIARNSSFTFRGKLVDVKQVAVMLGVQYVLEGSVRKSANRVRVTAQLINGLSGDHIWAEKYDGQLDDIFDLQDEITRNVVASVQTQIQLTVGAHAKRSDRPNIRTWDLVARAWKLFYELTPESLSQAEQLLRRAVELEPLSCEAHHILAGVIIHAAQMGYTKNIGEATAESYALSRKAVTLNDRDEYAHWILGFIQLWRRNYDDAIGELERAIELNPNCSLAYGSLGTVLSYAGQPEKSIANNEIAIRANPLDISIFFRFSGISMAHFVAERYSDAAEWARRTIQRKENWRIGHMLLVASLERLDRHDDARSALERFLELFPNTKLSDAERLPFKRSVDARRFVEGLRKAGLPG